jgi:hypothetical protein
MIELPEEVNPVLYNFPNQSLENNFDPKNFPTHPQSTINTQCCNGACSQDSKSSLCNYAKKKEPKFQISNLTVFNNDYKPTGKQIFTPNIIDLLCTKEEEIKQEMNSNKDPEVLPNGKLFRYFNNHRNFNQWTYAINSDL